MTLKDKLTKDLERICAERLDGIGIQRREARIFTQTTIDQNLLWIGLVIEKHRANDAIFLTPHIGYRHQRLQEVIAEVEGEKFHQYLPPTIAMDIGYLDKESRPLSIQVTDLSSAYDAAGNLVERIISNGFPFCDSMTLDGIIRILPEFAIWEDAGERLLAAYYLIGKSEAELKTFASERIAIGKSENRFFERFETFANRFFAWLHDRSSGGDS